MDNEKYITIKELADLKGVSTRAIRLSKGKYITREIKVKGGKSFEILLSSIEPELQEKYYSKIIPAYTEKQLPAPTDFHKPDKAKVIERFFLEMQESFEKLLPSYIGTNIENKPARLRRNEKFHSEIHTEFTPTIQQTIQMINSWLEYKNSLPCPNDRTKSIKEMLDSIEKQEINPRELDDLMLAQEIKTITSQGIRFLKSDYYNDALYGLRQKVIIKYSLFDLIYINVYTITGKFLCRAERITLTHPLARYTGEINDIEDYKQKIQKQKQLKNKTIKACKEFLNIEDLEILECQMDKILKVAKRLKTFTLEDIVMFCEIDAETAERFLRESENIKQCGYKFEYIDAVKTEDKFKIIDKNIPCKNSDITVTDACISFLNVSQSRNIKQNTVKAYKTFINAHIIPYFKGFVLKDITVSHVESFRKCMQMKQISERRIKNILTLLNQIIKYFQNEGYIDKTCVFEVKRVADIPKRQIQILTPEQLTQLFKIINKKYPYLTPIIKNLITLKQPLNTILTGSEQEKKSLKRKIRKDFYKIKQELGLINYMFDDLRFSNLDN